MSGDYPSPGFGPARTDSLLPGIVPVPRAASFGAKRSAVSPGAGDATLLRPPMTPYPGDEPSAPRSPYAVAGSQNPYTHTGTLHRAAPRSPYAPDVTLYHTAPPTPSDSALDVFSGPSLYQILEEAKQAESASLQRTTTLALGDLQRATTLTANSMQRATTPPAADTQRATPVATGPALTGSPPRAPALTSSPPRRSSPARADSFASLFGFPAQGQSAVARVSSGGPSAPAGGGAASSSSDIDDFPALTAPHQHDPPPLGRSSSPLPDDSLGALAAAADAAPRTAGDPFAGAIDTLQEAIRDANRHPVIVAILGGAIESLKRARQEDRVKRRAASSRVAAPAAPVASPPDATHGAFSDQSLGELIDASPDALEPSDRFNWTKYVPWALAVYKVTNKPLSDRAFSEIAAKDPTTALACRYVLQPFDGRDAAPNASELVGDDPSPRDTAEVLVFKLAKTVLSHYLRSKLSSGTGVFGKPGAPGAKTAHQTALLMGLASAGGWTTKDLRTKLNPLAGALAKRQRRK